MRVCESYSRTCRRSCLTSLPDSAYPVVTQSRHGRAMPTVAQTTANVKMLFRLLVWLSVCSCARSAGNRGDHLSCVGIVRLLLRTSSSVASLLRLSVGVLRCQKLSALLKAHGAQRAVAGCEVGTRLLVVEVWPSGRRL